MLQTPNHLIHESPYQTIYDDNGNIRGFLNHDTGEQEECILVSVPIGTKVITPGQQARNEVYKQLCEKKEMDAPSAQRKKERAKLYRSFGRLLSACWLQPQSKVPPSRRLRGYGQLFCHWRRQLSVSEKVVYRGSRGTELDNFKKSNYCRKS